MDKQISITGQEILLVEDEFYVRDLYRMILESAGFKVTLAEDGEEGYRLAQNLPSLILLDIMIPKLNGIMLLKKIKSDPRFKNIPIVLLTNLGQESIIKTAFDEGASGYFIKAQLNPDKIVSQVTRFLEQPSLVMDRHDIVTD